MSLLATSFIRAFIHTPRSSALALRVVEASIEGVDERPASAVHLSDRSFNMEQNMIRVLIVEEYEGMRQGLYDLLKDLPYVGTIDIADDLVKASRLLRRSKYDVVVLGLKDADRSGLGVIQAFRQISPLTSVLLLGLSIDTRLALWPVRFGIMGYIPKEAIVEELPVALQHAAAGKPYIPRMYSEAAAPIWMTALQATVEAIPVC
uniref:Response regulator transcription factor n=1 Tax=Caldilinea aerophila TaxID=133453 RepID=A0A7C1JLE7_9CHLR